MNTFVDYKKCYDAIAKWSDNLDTSESHYLMRIIQLATCSISFGTVIYIVLMLMTTFQQCRDQITEHKVMQIC